MATAVLVLYLLAVIAIGFYMRRRVRTEKDYLAAGGTLGEYVERWKANNPLERWKAANPLYAGDTGRPA